MKKVCQSNRSSSFPIPVAEIPFREEEVPWTGQLSSSSNKRKQNLIDREALLCPSFHFGEKRERVFQRQMQVLRAI
jgi:hypothetical protein